MSDKEATDFSAALAGFKRGNPSYFENEAIDHLIGIVLELGAELTVTRDRLARLEETLANGDPVRLDDLDTGRPSAELKAKLDQERQAFIQRVYGRLYARFGGDKASAKTAL
jgi:hypothetical protein